MLKWKSEWKFALHTYIAFKASIQQPLLFNNKKKRWCAMQHVYALLLLFFYNCNTCIIWARKRWITNKKSFRSYDTAVYRQLIPHRTIYGPITKEQFQQRFEIFRLEVATYNWIKHWCGLAKDASTATHCHHFNYIYFF